VTAYDEYAIRAFKVNSLDYLLKPVEAQELEEAFQKYDHYGQKFIQAKNLDTKVNK
jgi:DNA-binding LytR/AlgR family response regulator